MDAFPSAATEAHDVNSTLRVCPFFTWSTVLQVHVTCRGPQMNHMPQVKAHREKERERETGRGTEKVVPGVVFAATSSSPGYRRERRSSSLLFTRPWNEAKVQRS